MAGKSWRDYSTDETVKKETSSEKTGSWRDYSTDQSAASGKSSGGWRDYSKFDITGAASSNVTSRVNAWLKNHNSYLSDYNNRYSGRKYSYDDAYVSDSGSWLETVNKRVDDYEAERQEILSYLDQYSDYLDAKWVKSIRETLDKGRNAQLQIQSAAQKDNEYWLKFTPNEDQVAAGYTADKVYQEWQTGQKQYAEDMAFDLKAGTKEIEDLEAQKNALLQELDASDSSIGTANVDRAAMELVKTIESLDKQIAEKKASLDRVKYVQGYEGYMDNINSADYAANSKYVSTRTDVAKEDAIWGFPANKYDESKLFGDYLYDYINRNEDALSVASVNNTASSAYFLGLDQGFLQTMSDDEIGVYNYLYNTQGKESANEYLKYIESDLEGRRKAQEQKYWADYAKASPVGSSVFSTLVSPLKGISYLSQAADMLDDGKMDQNAGYNRFSYIPSTIRSQVSTTIENSGKWGDVGSFAYNTGMSMADFLFTTAVSGGNQGLSLAIMGTGAAADATIAAKERGLDDSQAFTLGTIAGLAEVAMEKISLGAWLEGDMTEGALKYMLKNALSEGAEEAGTSVINLLADVIVSGDKSEWNMAMQAYIDEGKSPEEAFGLVAAEQAAQIGLDALGGALSGTAIGGGTYAGSSVAAGFQYSDIARDKTSAQKLVTEGLELNPDSQYVQKMQSKLDNGKNLTGMQVRNILAANQEQVTANDMKKIQQAAEQRLTDLGQTKDVQKLAEIATKWATGQEITRAEKSLLTHSEYGSRVANELLPENIASDDYSTEWAEEIGTKQVNKAAYNKKAIRSILDSMVNAEDNATYKSLEERVGTESRFGVSESGTATIRESGEEISLDNVEVVKAEDGQMTIKLTDGREVYAGDIDFADDTQAYAFSAVADIENITPAAATAIIRDIDLSKSVGTQLNGIDEAYTYGFHGYSVEDLKAGNFASTLSTEQMMSAYKLGQSARNISDTSADAPAVKMRTASEAKQTAEQKTAQQKARIDSKDVEVYFQDGKSVVKFDEHTGKYDAKRKAAINTAKFLSRLGIGGKYYFYESYVNDDGVRVYKDANGNEVEAPNGMYKDADGSIHIDLNAGDAGQGTALFTMGHELTHFIKAQSKSQFKVLGDLVTEAFDKTDLSMHERVLAKQKFLEEKRGKAVPYSEAYEEVVADAMSTMLTDGSFYEKIMEIKVKDKGLFNTIKRFFDKMIAKFKKVYEELTPDQRDARDIREMKDMFDRIQTAFAEALVEASDNYQATLVQSGIAVNDKTDSGSLESVRYVLNDADRKKTAKALAERFQVTEKEAVEWLKAETSLASLILNPKYSAFLDYEADPDEVAIKQNSDYPQGTVDFSNICKKRREFTQVMNRILRNFPSHVFAATDLAKIRTIMGEEGMTLPCGICYVEDRRQLDTIVAQDFIDGLKLYREGSKTRPDGKPFNTNQLKGLQLTDGDTYVPTIYELVSLEGRNSLKAKNPNMEAAWVKYNNARGMQAVRLLTNEAEYKRQILKYSPKTVQSKNDHGGLRIYSFSDAEMFHLIDIIQVITDSATVGLCLQGYTKVNEYAKAVKDTGEKLNRSLIPKGDLGYHIENGKVVLDYDTVEGIDIYSEDFFDNKDNPDVGNITIGINDVQIRAAMISDFVDQIIPFHTGQSEEVLGEKGIAAWDNYKDYQTEKDIATGRTSSHQVNIYTEVFQAAEKEGKPIQNKRQFVEKFLQVCKENGLQPRFSQFLNVDSNGDYVYTEGYHKLLVDFKTFAQTEVGEYLPQMPVKPFFDDGYITGLLESYVKEQQIKDAEVAEQMPKVIDRITNEIVKPAKDVYKKSDRHDGTREGVDTSQKVPYHKEKTVEQEANGNERREETRESFLRRAGETSLEVGERGTLAFGYRHYYGQLSKNIQAAEKGLKNLGIPVVVFEHMEGNKDGVTTIFNNDALSIPGVAVFIHKDATVDSLEIVGHEGYHYLKGSDIRVAYREVVAENIDFSSKAIIDYQQKYVGDSYFSEDVVIGSKEWDTLIEELFAYITGHIHVGDPRGEVHKFLRDYDAVKAAWDDLLKKQSSSGVRNSDRDSTGKQLTKEQQEFFKNSMVRDAEGNLLKVYHTTPNANFTVFDPSYSDDKLSLFFTDNIDMSRSYDGSSVFNVGFGMTVNTMDNTAPIVDANNLPGRKIFNFKNRDGFWVSDTSKINEALDYFGIKYSLENGKYTIPEFDSSFNDGRHTYTTYFKSKDPYEVSSRLSVYQDDKSYSWEGTGWKRRMINPYKGTYACYLNIENPLEVDAEGSKWSEIPYGGKKFTTRDLAKIAKRNGNDGVIIRNVLDNGSGASSTSTPSTVTIAFNSNQVKSVDNTSPTDNDDIRFSERGDGASNRDLLANAFEGITKSSIEYKMLQDYKSHIKELNELETKLHQLNAEIRKIRFGTEGARDTQKLAQLESEAKEVAKEINRYDKRLLSLEASEPLRKVIERERKKEAQKTKAHVEEIQQNKKVRAEQTELRHKIRKTIRDLDKILNRGNKKLNVKEDVQNVVTKALQAADILFTDNFGTYDMLRSGIKADLSDAEEALVESCTKMLKDLDKMPTDGYENWQARQEAENRLKTKMSKLKDVFARERKRLNNTTVSSILGELADAYASLEKSEQSYVQGAYTEAVHNFLKNLQSEVGGTIVKDMTKDQLESVYAAYQMVLTTVRKANKMFNEELKQSREQLGNAVIQEVRQAGGVHLLGTKMGDAISQASWNNMKPIWVGNRIGSDTFGKLMNGLFKGQYNFAVDIDEAKRFKLEMDGKYHPRNWDAEKQYKFESSTGKEFSLNLQQIMSLYAFSKREQAYSHLLNGGFVFENNSTIIVEEDGRKKTYIHKGATSYKLNEATLNSIISSLTKEQKAYVDEMQKYLSEVMGAKGNEVSMQLYGIKMFKEQFYFPLRSSGAYMERAKEAEMKKQQGQINLVNSGFTHAVKPEAKNPIILSGFMDVWAEHCNEMSMYHSMVLPMEDFRKVYNYSTVHDDKFDSASVFQTIQDAYGDAATNYIDQLYRELNAGATIDPRETPFKKLISNFKKTAVMLSASVVVQQFSSIGRAYAIIDPKYFVGAKVNSDTKLSVADEMKKYAPVAIIKEMGGFDTGTKGSAKSYIMAEQYGKGERIQGLLKDDQYRSDIMGYAPAKADEITWCAIWEAVKRETKAKNPKMDIKSEEFLKLAGDRFSEVIEKTQVYDSVLARSANMRSKTGLMQMATSFMAEPTTTVNLLEDAIRSGDKAHMARAFGAVAVSIVLNNALASVVYAMRDDDEDETFIEKYFQSFTSGMIDDINPMSYYPFLKDVYSLFQGYDVERADMSVIADLRDALKKVVGLLGKDTSGMDDDELAAHHKQVNEVFMGLLDAGCSVFGVPLKNVRRDANGLINAFSTVGKDLSGDRNTTWLSFWDKVGAAAKDTVPGLAWTKDKAKTDKLYEAIVNGDKSYLSRLKSTYKTDSAYQSAVRKALRENDPRIHEAAQAKYDGKAEEYKRLFREIQKEGKFTFDDIMSAINSEESKIRNGLEPDKVTSSYTASDFVEAVAMGNASEAKTMMENIISTKVANGKTQEEAEKEFASNVSTGIGEAYSAGLLDETGAKNMLVEYAGKDEEEAASKVSYWDFCNAHPQYDLNESQVGKYKEFAEPAEIPLDVFVQYINGTKSLVTEYDEWGDVDVTKREQVLEVIDSLPLTWQQKDALYLAAGYSESKIWDVPW